MRTRWQPWGELQAEMQQLHDEMNRLFGRYGNGLRGNGRSMYPPVNLWEDENNFYVETELPGFQMDDLEIYVTQDNQLSLKGQRRQPDVEKATWHRQECGYGSFARLLELPGLVDSDNVTAAFANGVLTITMPKREVAKPRRIEVKSQ